MRKKAFTLVEIMIVMMILGMLAMLGFPSYFRAREGSRQKACINNLRQIDSAKEQWSMEKNKAGSDTVELDELAVYLKGAINDYVVCPAAGTYACTTVEDGPTCDYDNPVNPHVLPPN